MALQRKEEKRYDGIQNLIKVLINLHKAVDEKEENNLLKSSVITERKKQD